MVMNVEHGVMMTGSSRRCRVRTGIRIVRAGAVRVAVWAAVLMMMETGSGAVRGAVDGSVVERGIVFHGAGCGSGVDVELSGKGWIEGRRKVGK